MPRIPELIDCPRRAAELLRGGGLVAFPTETVYGLGVDATNERAVERLFQVKGRPSNNPLIVHIADIDSLKLAAREVPNVARRLLDRFAPGPLTVVVPKQPSISDLVTAGLDTVGVRIPAEPRALEMLRYAQRPIAAPSANRSGKPSCTNVQSVIEDFGDAINGILVGEIARIGLESTVVECTRKVPKLLRPGAISIEQLRSVEPTIIAAGRSVEAGENSPGRLHPHYQPHASVQLFTRASDVNADAHTAYLGLAPHPQSEAFGWYQVFQDNAEYARQFYESLREVDRRGLTTVYCQTVSSGELQDALMDRLSRAAE